MCSMVTVADGHQTFYYTLMINMVINIDLTSFSTSQESIFQKNEKSLGFRHRLEFKPWLA